MRESRQFFDSVILPYPKDKRQLFILQEFLENDGLVMDFILRTIKKRHRALLKFFPDKGNELLRIRISRKFFRISFLELLEFFRIMAEPFPKLRRWGNRLVPDTERCLLLGNAPRPEPVCQNTEAVRLLGRFIYALYLYIHKNSSFLLYFPYTFL